MTMSLRSKDLASFPAVVGTVHTPAGLRQAQGLARREVDFLELRIDAFANSTAPLRAAIPKLKPPLLITVRHPLEGAVLRLTPARRLELFEQFLPFATLIDLELRSAKKFAPLIRKAQAAGTTVILSHHDFARTPARKQLHRLAGLSRQLGGDIFKVAAVTSSPKDIATLLGFMAAEKRIPLSVMGMGNLGKISRLLFARTGSLLNYGFLDKAHVRGQWPAVLLKQRLTELE